MTPTKLFAKRFLLVILFCISQNLLTSSDHIDGPVTSAHSVADITGLFAFPSPDIPGQLVLIMNVYPGVAKSGHFTEKVSYNFLVRHANILGEASIPGFGTSGDYQVSCTFETPHGFFTPHWITCKSSSGSTVRVKVGEMSDPGSDKNLQVYAGRRSDPFFFNAGWAVSASKGKIDPPKDLNVMQDLNTLSIVLVIDIEKEMGLDQGSLFAVAAETTTKDGDNIRRIDRIGRPEITNITMANNGRQELRDLYNAQKSFDLTGKNVELFRQRLHNNIMFYDSLNNTTDWTPKSVNDLAEILLNDFLVVDVSKPFSKDTYFDIEYSVLKGNDYTTCGGRVPNDDIIDVIFTMLINGGNNPQIRDGVDKPTKWATEEFPYLAAPTDSFVSEIKSFIGRSADKLTSSKTLFLIGIMELLSGLFFVIGTFLLLYYFVRMGISLIGKHEYSSEKHTRLMFWVGIMFGLAAIIGVTTGSFSHVNSAIFTVVSILAFYYYRRWKSDS